MQIKLWILLVCLVVFAQKAPSVGANCTCDEILKDPYRKPEYCTSEFLGIVKITSVVIDETHEKQNYYFELVTDLTHQVLPRVQNGPRTSLKGFQAIDESIGECAHLLKVNQTYLIGSYLEGDDQKRQPMLYKCSGWVESWDYLLEKSNTRLDEYNEECNIVVPHEQPYQNNTAHFKTPGK